MRTISQNSQISVELQNQLIAQLDRNIRLKDLDWLTADEKSIEAAQNCYKLLGQYTIYTPGAYGFPLKQTCYYIDTFGADRDGGKRSHEGTDLFDQKGTPILSVTPGKIEKLGWNRLGGERVGVRGDDGNYYYYAHLDKISEDLYLHKRVNKGEFIGTMGNTGDAITTPDHLHFGIELPNGEWVNPYPFLKVWEFYSLNGK